MDPIKPEDIEKEKSRAYQEMLLRRMREMPDVPTQVDDNGVFQFARPEDIYEQQGSTGTVMADDGTGSMKRVGVQHYAMQGMEPLKPEGLRQDWGDARGGNDTSALNNTVRLDTNRATMDGNSFAFASGEPTFISRNKAGEDDFMSGTDASAAMEDRDLNTDGAITLDTPESGYSPADSASEALLTRLRTSQKQPTASVPPLESPYERKQRERLAGFATNFAKIE